MREPSHVLRAMGAAPSFAQGTVRFSLGRATTPEQIDRVAKAALVAISGLRKNP
jgi:cysteine desulfurase